MADIPASEPIIIPPVPEQVFDQWRVPSFRVEWHRPTEPMTAEAIFTCCRRGEDGVLIDGRVSKLYMIDDLWTLAAQDQEVATVLESLVAVLTRKARESGVI